MPNLVTADLLSADISCDESSYPFTGTVELARVEDWADIQPESLLTVDLYGEQFLMMVESKQLERSIDLQGAPQRRPVLTLISPVAMFADPRCQRLTKTWDKPVSAKAAAEWVLSQIPSAWPLSTQQTAQAVQGANIDWQILDWWLPAYRLAVSNGVPVEFVSNLVKSVGGVLQSKPDGTLLVRPLWPQGGPDQSYDDQHDVLEYQEQFEPGRIVNKLRLLDVAASFKDKIEWEVNKDDPMRGTLHIYPSPWRIGVKLRHTSGAWVSLGSMAETVRSETETIEFKAGIGSTRFPIDALDAVTWEVVSLGAISFARWSTQLEAATKDYSLASISYRVRSLDAAMSSSQAADIQVVLEDAPQQGNAALR